MTLKSLILARDTACPRYTSYPAAPHFSADIGAGTYEEWLRSLAPQTPLSLYVHIPFCAKMCHYCGCHTKITERYAPVEDYVTYLRREIAHVTDRLPVGMTVRHVHFGGGSPSMLLPQDFRAIMDSLRERFLFAPDAEVAIELDPRTLTADKADAYAAAGVTRVSLGVQDTNDQVLEAVNRPQPFETVYKGVTMLRARGITRFNVDLMYGLPYQTLRGMQRNIDYCMLLKPDRLAVFGYAHVPWMKKHMTLINEGALPDASLRYDLMEVARAELVQAGYTMLGIDHFAKDDDALASARDAGRLRRNFQGYTDDDADTLIGFGVSSIGHLPGGYIQNFADIPRYRDAVLDGQLPISRGYVMTRDDHIRARVVEQIMCYLRVDLAKVAAEFNVGLDYFAAGITRARADLPPPLLQIDGPVLTLNPDAYMIARLLARAFDAYHKEADLDTSTPVPRHARAV